MCLIHLYVHYTSVQTVTLFWKQRQKQFQRILTEGRIQGFQGLQVMSQCLLIRSNLCTLNLKFNDHISYTGSFCLRINDATGLFEIVCIFTHSYRKLHCYRRLRRGYNIRQTNWQLLARVNWLPLFFARCWQLNTRNSCKLSWKVSIYVKSQFPQ